MKLLILKKLHNGLLYTSSCYYKTDEITITMQIKATLKEQRIKSNDEGKRLSKPCTEEMEFVYHLQKFERIGHRMLISSYSVLFFCWVFSTCTRSAHGLASWHKISYLNIPTRMEAGSPRAQLGCALKMKINIGHWHSVLLTGFPAKC